MSQIKNNVLVVALMLLLTRAEFACANLAWETIGEGESAMLLSLVWFNILPLLIYFLKFKKIAVGLALIIAVLIIPHQLLLGYRWHLLQQDVDGIIAYVSQVKKQTGAYPSKLSTYEFLHPGLARHITYKAFKSSAYHQTADGTYIPDGHYNIPDFSVSFYIETPTTPHIYTATGDWWYYPE